MNETYLIKDRTGYTNINYMFSSLQSIIKRLNGSVEKSLNEKVGDTSWIKITVPSQFANLTKDLISDKIADAIAVNYKYKFFTKYIRTAGISQMDYQMLLSAAITADLDEDRAFIQSGKWNLSDFSIDGYFNFRLKPLKRKWSEIVTYIPTWLSKEKLKNFVCYIIKEKPTKRAIIYQNKVYDKNYNRMQLSLLLDKMDSCNIAREVILCGFNEIELAQNLESGDKKYLVDFFGDKIFFKNTKRAEN